LNIFEDGVYAAAEESKNFERKLKTAPICWGFSKNFGDERQPKAREFFYVLHGRQSRCRDQWL